MDSIFPIVILYLDVCYFYDLASKEEVQAILNFHSQKEQREWEKLRILCFNFLAPYSNNLKLTDVLKFPWDQSEIEIMDNWNALEIANQRLELIRQKETSN